MINALNDAISYYIIQGADCGNYKGRNENGEGLESHGNALGKNDSAYLDWARYRGVLSMCYEWCLLC